MKLSSLILLAACCASLQSSTADSQKDQTNLQLTKYLRARLKATVDVPTSPPATNATDTSVTHSLLRHHVAPRKKDTLSRFAEPLYPIEELMFAQDECTSPIADWYRDRFDEIVEKLGYEALDVIDDYLILDMAWIFKYFVDQDEKGEYFGTRGEYTKELKKRRDKLEKFWEGTDDDNSLTTDNILLLGMHGKDLQSKKNMEALLKTPFYYGDSLSKSELKELARDLQNFIKDLPGGFKNPLLTANAFAIPGDLVTEIMEDGNVYPDGIVMGDGCFEFLESLGLDKDGPDNVLAHEFGHQMQFEANIDDLDENGHARLIELMADAFAAYFMAHLKGGKVCIERIVEIQEAAFSVGDCDPDGVHGRPAERECATLWAASLALKHSQDNEALSPLELRALFLDDFEDILDLDEEVCAFEVPADMEPIKCKKQ